MSDDHRSNTDSFQTTHWPLVHAARANDPAVRRQALEELLVRYLPALRAHLASKKRVPADRVGDLLQGFVASKLLEQDLIARADPRKGRFRALLVTALDHYLISVHRHDHAKKRSAHTVPLEAEGSLAPPDPAEPPSSVFDIAWAREVLNAALARMCQECLKAGRPEVWGVFEARIVRPTLESVPVLSYDDLVTRYGFRSPMQASNVLVTARRMFARTLRAVVSEYAGDAEAVEDEIRDLLRILSAGGQGN